MNQVHSSEEIKIVFKQSKNIISSRLLKWTLFRLHVEKWHGFRGDLSPHPEG